MANNNLWIGCNLSLILFSNLFPGRTLRWKGTDVKVLPVKRRILPQKHLGIAFFLLFLFHLTIPKLFWEQTYCWWSTMPFNFFLSWMVLQFNNNPQSLLSTSWKICTAVPFFLGIGNRVNVRNQTISIPVSWRREGELWNGGARSSIPSPLPSFPSLPVNPKSRITYSTIWGWPSTGCSFWKGNEGCILLTIPSRDWREWPLTCRQRHAISQSISSFGIQSCPINLFFLGDTNWFPPGENEWVWVVGTARSRSFSLTPRRDSFHIVDPQRLTARQQSVGQLPGSLKRPPRILWDRTYLSITFLFL